MAADTRRAPLDIRALRSEIIGSEGPWRQLDVVAETGSTNADLLARSAAGHDIDGSVLLAEYQKAGRGRQGRSWSAPPRSQIAMSVGVGVSDVPPDVWGWLPLMTGVAVVDAVREMCDIVPGLKWPNDVLVESRKLAGILAEVASPQPVIVVGLGLNVTLTDEDVPVPEATSLLMLGAPVIDRNLLAGKILNTLGARIEGWRSAAGPDSSLIAAYRRHSLTLGTKVRVSLPGDRQVVGTAQAIDELGRLLIDTHDGPLTVSAGDVTHLRPVRG